MDAERWRAFRLRWMLPFYLVFGIAWFVAVALQLVLEGPPSPLGWFYRLLMGLIAVVGIVTEWRFRKEERRSKR